MQLHYNILWIDNDLPEYIERGQIERLNDFLSDLGFEPNVVTLFDEKELDDHLKKTKFDLIVSDYQLDNTTGDKIIENIRDKYLTEILFYSAKVNFRDDQEVKNRLAFLDRISFHTGRDTLLERIEKLIELTLEKLLDLNATRGIITSATSELDVTIEGLTHYVLIEKLKKSEKELSSIVEEYVSDFLEKSPENFRGKLAEMGFKNVFGLIEANRKWQIFRKAIKEFKSLNDDQILTEFLNQNKTYFTEIIDIRNKFAHAKAEEKEGKLVLKGQYGKEDFEFDIDSCVQIRKSIIAHKNNFDKLKVHFGI
ncbi:hypothetical protein [Flagellimonas marina]|uniref:Response regulatory domain-containing protein n=1 Tax=Flagellimonas marina TaxID=1775168 RepID=A0ABV8PL23_9FLAO